MACRFARLIGPLVIVAALVACGRALEGPALGGSASIPSPPLPWLPVVVERTPLLQPYQPCSNTFVVHRLMHTTTAGGVVKMFESNGSGLAINDLDGDGQLDIVLANLAAENT